LSKLRQEIKACMLKLDKADNFKLSARFCFPEKFIGFKGHFPDKPILPGVCKIQAAILMLEEAKHKSIRLKEILLAKFFAPVTFNQEVVFSLEEHPENNLESLVEVKVNCAGKKIAELHLRTEVLK
jgi:3-hydroxymyristoyl/3-hydroxydecanoyl-(acyl carrier protein) dehydratase